MKKVLYLIISLTMFMSADTISFKELTALASADLHKNIYLDQDIKNYSVDINLADNQKDGQIYEFYKIVLFGHDLLLQYNRRGDFYYVKEQANKKEELKVLEAKPLLAPVDRLHYYTYKIKNTTNEDVVNAMSIFPNVRFKYLEQTDTIAYSANRSDHLQVQKILRRADYKVSTKTIRLTMFAVNRKNLSDIGSKISDFSFNFNSGLGYLLDSLNSGSNTSHELSGSANFSFILSALEKRNIINIMQKPTILLSNGKQSAVNSVVNVPYLKTSSTVDSNTNSVTEQYDYKDIGLQIRIKPKIKDNWVYLELNLISDELISLDDDKPITQKISYKNTVTIFNGKPVLLTGIRKTSQTFEKSGVPFLSDLPYLGNLFKFKSKSFEDQNINILIEIVDSKKVKRMTKEAYKATLDLF